MSVGYQLWWRAHGPCKVEAVVFFDSVTEPYGKGLLRGLHLLHELRRRLSLIKDDPSGPCCPQQRIRDTPHFFMKAVKSLCLEPSCKSRLNALHLFIFPGRIGVTIAIAFMVSPPFYSVSEICEPHASYHRREGTSVLVYVDVWC